MLYKNNVLDLDKLLYVYLFVNFIVCKLYLYFVEWNKKLELFVFCKELFF